MSTTNGSSSFALYGTAETADVDIPRSGGHTGLWLLLALTLGVVVAALYYFLK